jgi:3-deoxy-D-manno-octulosonic-acid transferase
MYFLYMLGIRLYGCILRIASLFNPKAKSWVAGRTGFWRKLPVINSREVYWFHCASLGEFDQGLPLMNRLKSDNPDIFVLVTFFSPSGYEHYHKRQHTADFVCYLPLDTRRNARRFIQHFQPKQVFFIKYEFWVNYIAAAQKSGAAIYSVSALFRADHRFFRWYGGIFRKTLRQIDHFFVQNTRSLELLRTIHITNATLCGDTRFDRVIENKRNVQADEVIADFLQGRKAFVLGSTWREDEDFLEKLVLKQCQSIPVIIAPHDISEAHLKSIEKRFAPQLVRYSQWQQGGGPFSILLIDSIGKLANAYSYGRVAYVGGGFSGNLHNILEPAVFGLPVIFGPKHKRFPEGEMFIDAGVGFSVATPEELANSWAYILDNEATLREKTAALVANSTGATQRILDYLHRVK